MKWVSVVDKEDWVKRLKPQIFRAWKLEGNKWIQAGLKRAFHKQKTYSETRSKNAKSRWEKTKSKDAYAEHVDKKDKDAHALHMQCSSSSSSTSVNIKENN